MSGDFAEGGVGLTEVISSGWAVHEGEGEAALVEGLGAAGGDEDEGEEEDGGGDEAASDGY